MELFEAIISNAWFIGIAIGLIGFLVKEFLNRFRENKEYLRDTRNASKEVLDTLITLIVENELPKSSMLISLHQATARKYNLKVQDLDELTIIFDSLIKEIIDSSFLTYKSKNEYCTEVEKAKNDMKSASLLAERVSQIDEKIRGLSKKNEVNNQKRVLSFLAAIGVSTSFVIMINSLFKIYNFEINKDILIGVGQTISVIALVFALLTLIIAVIINSKKIVRSPGKK